MEPAIISVPNFLLMTLEFLMSLLVKLMKVMNEPSPLKVTQDLKLKLR